jgi:RHS repeat-associated protein
MKSLIGTRAFRALCVLLAVAGQGAAIFAQSGPPSKDRYIIVLKPSKNGVPELSDHDITAGGGTVEYKVPGRIQVILPAPAVEALRRQERVKYIQRVILGPLPDASAPAALRTTPSTASLRATVESTPLTWRSGTYKYDASGNIYAIGLAGETGSPVQHRYAYDELSRLKQADTLTTPTHTETFTYDAYGNLTEHVDGSSTTSTPVEDPNTNRLAWSAAHPYTYDAAGNLTADYNATYAYDPVGMLREKDYGSKQEFYIYTASDERIGVKYGTSSGSPTIWSIRDFSGNVLRQYEGHDQSPQMAWLWVEDYVYRDGQLLAAERVPEEGGRRHFHLDHLGSPRLVTGQDSKEMSEHDYEPFGLESSYQETAGGFDREDPQRFTGHERDYAAPPDAPASAYYLDYMHARFYNPTTARFLSVDPAKNAVLTKPQSWNRYGYADNNPVRKLDLNGRVTFDSVDTHRDYQVAVRYLSNSAFGRNLIERFESLSGSHEPNLASGSQSQYNPRTNTILWNPRATQFIPESWLDNLPSKAGREYQSPALGLLHEIAHALRNNENPTAFKAESKGTDIKPSREEERATKVEAKAAQELGEATRFQYAGSYTSEEVPASTTLVEYYTKLALENGMRPPQ